MKKVLKLKDLECAHCAAKMEEAISRLNGVQSVRVNFMTQKMTLEADDLRFNQIVEEAARVIRKIEPDCTILR